MVPKLLPLMSLSHLELCSHPTWRDWQRPHPSCCLVIYPRHLLQLAMSPTLLLLIVMPLLRLLWLAMSQPPPVSVGNVLTSPVAVGNVLTTPHVSAGVHSYVPPTAPPPDLRRLQRLLQAREVMKLRHKTSVGILKCFSPQLVLVQQQISDCKSP